MAAVALTRVPVTAGSSGWSERQRLLVDLDRRVRVSLPTSRRVSVLSLAGGCGVSTIAAHAAAYSAARRKRPVLAVDACGARVGLAELLGIGDDERVTELDPVRTSAESLAEATHGLVRRGDCAYLGLGRLDATVWPSDVDEWHAATAGIGRFFSLVVTDWGRRRDLGAIAEIARASHTLCLVAPADRRGLEQTATLVPAIRAEPGAPDVVIAVVDIARYGAAATRIDIGDLDARVLRVPFDARLASGLPAGARTRRSWLAVTADLVAGPAKGRP